MKLSKFASALIDDAFSGLFSHVTGSGDPLVVRGERPPGLSLEDALFAPPGGFRSTLGTLKHIAAWTHVYHSYAFEDEPKHWADTGWPLGLRDSIEPSDAYLEAILQWIRQGHEKWMTSLSDITDQQLSKPRPLHWGAEAPLITIVTLVANHVVYHTGEINQLLAIRREQGWEESEEVEENHLPSDGHRVVPLWMTESAGAGGAPQIDP